MIHADARTNDRVAHGARQAYFVLADISGFIAYLKAVELEHADEILSELLDLIGKRFELVPLQHTETLLQVRRAVFLNGSVYMHLHRRLLTQRLLRMHILGPWLARLSTQSLFRRQFARLLARRDLLSDEEYDAYWSLLQVKGGRRVIAKVAQYMNEPLKRTERWVEPLKHIEMPLLLLWGQADPVAVPAIAERLQQAVPNAQLVWLPGVGRYPQLEAPEQVASAIERFLA